jgi:hypothetical protein
MQDNPIYDRPFHTHWIFHTSLIKKFSQSIARTTIIIPYQIYYDEL